MIFFGLPCCQLEVWDLPSVCSGRGCTVAEHSICAFLHSRWAQFTLFQVFHDRYFYLLTPTTVQR